ncbi:MAG: MFS transporter [Elusimicrobia bacterium]|nr:MFS transporter [Elusimicrobiota bacterium]
MLGESASSPLEKSTLAKVSARILPFVFLLYIVAFLDRVNIGYAALDMNRDLGLGPEQFGFLSGIFFAGYFLFEVPSNILLHRFGARRWIARILVSWGAVVMAMACVTGASHVAWLRFLLGVAEAGFFPGIILYITYWFPARAQARAVALFMTALTVSNVLGAPLSTWIMDNVRWLGFPGWRWLFVLEGVPAVLLGAAAWFYMTDRPAQAAWLSAEQRLWLEAELDAERAGKLGGKTTGLWGVLCNRRVLALSLIYFGQSVAMYGIVFWLPQLIRQLDGALSNAQIGLAAMIPYGVSAAAMVWWSRRSDRSGERRLHAAVSAGAAAVGFAACQFCHHPAAGLAALTVAACGVFSFYGPFWTLPPRFLDGEAAAVGIAAVNSIGNLGGFAGPFAIGWAAQAFGSIEVGLLFPAALMLLNVFLLLRLREISSTSNP